MKKLFLTIVLLTRFITSSWAFPNPVFFPQGWSLNKGYPREVNPEFKKIVDSKGAYKGKSYAFVRGHLTGPQISVKPGDEIEISFYAKDAESKDISCIYYHYYYDRTHVNMGYGGISTVFTAKPGPKWTPISGTLKIPKVGSDEEGFVSEKKPIDVVVIVLASNTGAYFDYPCIAHVKMSEFNNPGCARYEARGRLRLSEGDYERALEEFNNALGLAERQEEKKAIECQIQTAIVRKKVSVTAEKTQAFISSADSFVTQGRYVNARKEYQKMKQCSSNDDFLQEIALFNIAELYRLERNYSGVHRTYREIFSLSGLTDYYRLYGLFKQAEVYCEQKNYNKARQLYNDILTTESALKHHIFTAQLKTGDTYKDEHKYSFARGIYKNLLMKEETSEYPHEGYRRQLIDRLESIEGLSDGQVEESRQAKWLKKISSPRYGIYVSVDGKDTNAGTKDKPFATIKRAQEEVRRVKEKGMPAGGIVVYLRGGRYFITEGIVFEGEKDSGTERAPVVYRSYPGEQVRIIGGKQITNFIPLTDEAILKRLPEEARGKIWVADLKQAGIENYGKFFNRGFSYSHTSAISKYKYMLPGAMELFFNTRPMHLVRWPKEGWLRISDLVDPHGDAKGYGGELQKGRFRYSGDRPERWKDEQEIWIAGYFMHEWDKIHTAVVSIDTDNKIMNLAPDTRWVRGSYAYDMLVRRDAPYYLYNILSELSVAEEFYIDRARGLLYFYPPEKIEGSEIIVSTLEQPIVELKGVSHLVFFGLTMEATWGNAIEVTNGQDNLIAGCTIRNTGNMGVYDKNGWNHSIVGCDIYDTGEGGISVEGGDKERLIPSGHYVENNHIYRFNRFSHGGGKFGIVMSGIGNRASHNVVSDGTYIGILFGGNDNIVESNEVYDVMYEGRDGGAIYIHSGDEILRNRGNVMRYNFIHHINGDNSPIKTHEGHTGLYIDGISAGMTMEGNVFYLTTYRAMQNHAPDTRMENNIFIDNALGIYQYSNAHILARENESVDWWAKSMTNPMYKRNPWSSRYPQMKQIGLDGYPVGLAKNIVLERNINTGGIFVSIEPVIFSQDIDMKNNWDEGCPFFINPQQMDFCITSGSPVFGITGAEAVDVGAIGVYKDPLRASWPIKKIPAGKYYKGGL